MEDRLSPRADLDLLLRENPGHAAHIRRLYLSSDSFRGLCAEYSLACRSLSQFAPSGTDPPGGAAAEYAMLILELRTEIAAILLSRQGQGHAPK